MSERRGVTRRDFVRGTAGVAAGVSLFGVSWADQAVREPRSATVVLVRDQTVLSGDHQVDVAVLKEMLDQTVIRVTGRPSPREAWRSLVKPEDTVGLVATPHLNP